MPLVLIVLLVSLAGADLARASERQRESAAESPPPVSGRWMRPVDGEVVEAFVYDRAAPFARGAHRGADLAARPGEPVSAPCGGVVTFAGRVPGRGAGVTIACGGLVATLVELGGARVARGACVARGEVVGRTAARRASAAAGGSSPAVVHVGARRRGDAFGYVDPTSLFGREPTPLGPAPPARPPARPLAAARPAAVPQRAVTPPRVPVAAWVGLGLVVAGLPLGSLARRRRRAPMGIGRAAVPR